MVCLTQILLFFLCTVLITVSSRSIQQDSDVELLITNRINENKELTTTIASYRHRFGHSPNFKALRWAMSEQLTPPYCQFCHIFVPVVSLMYTCIFIPHYCRFRFDISLKLIRRSTLKTSLLLCAMISNFFLILMFVSEPYMNIRWTISIHLINIFILYVQVGRCDWNIERNSLYR
jgi:hypothetical protein